LRLGWRDGGKDGWIDLAEDADEMRMRRRGRPRLRVAAGAFAVLAAGLGGLWLNRVPIADHFIAGALREKGVPARYRITRIGPKTQRLEAVVLGPPGRPDLVAQWVEVDLAVGWAGVRVTGLRARGVRIAARYQDGKLSLGALDRLLPKGSGGAAELPDLIVDIADSRAAVASEFGPLALAFSGTGNLRSGFTGRLVATAPRLDLGACTLDRLSAPLALATEDGRFALKGPLAAHGLACPGQQLAIARPRIHADLRADPALADLTGAFALTAPTARQGARRLDTLSGLVTLKGSAREVEGNAALSAARLAADGYASAAARFGGRFALRPGAGNRAFSFAPTLTLESVRPTDSRRIARLADGAAGTPLAPLAARLAQALDAATRANMLSIGGRIDGDGQDNRLLINGARFASASGARFGLVPGAELRANLATGRVEMRGEVEMRGGGLPDVTAKLISRADGSLSGRVAVADYRAGTATLRLSPVRFDLGRSGTMSFATLVALDGPLPDGELRGFVMPVAARVSASGGLRFVRDCAPLRWTALAAGSLALDPARVELCGLTGQSLRLAEVALGGRIGESALRLAVASAGYDIASGQFALADLAVTIGGGDEPVRLAAARLEGQVAQRGGLAGRFDGGRASIGPVPLDLSELGGNWRFAGGRLAVDGGLRVADRLADARFNPLVARDVRLSLDGGRIMATGTLSPPVRQGEVARLAIVHDLANGVGAADFTVDGLAFGAGLQPNELTKLAQGVIANVAGVVAGRGRIAWSSAGVTASTGTFSTRDMDFAAAFGPVHGFATTIEFTDLLGMKTAPHQRMTLRQVSAGVDVFDGVIDYALLSQEQAKIETGHWPFSGGQLELLPATLDLDSRRPRNLAFRVRGLDAGAFINTLNLENISATGTFDGILPMLFDQAGGRIDGGVLIARQTGLPPLIVSAGDAPPACDTAGQAGSVAYVGAVSNAETGQMGQLAFDVLKHLRYRCMVIQLDGALDGEFVTRVSVLGVNQGSEAAGKSFLTRPFVGLPFRFNVRIEAPFRGLMSSAAAYADPSAAVREEVNRQLNAAGNTPLAVQPPDSDKALEGKTE
jgi:translocation and assembly module TamB